MLRNFIFAAATAALPHAGKGPPLTPQAAAEVVNQIIERIDTPIDPAIALQVQVKLLLALGEPSARTL